MTENIQNALKKIAFFADLPDDMLAQLAGQVVEQNLSAKEIIFREGEKGDTFYIIVSGGVEIYHPKDDTILDRLEAGEYFGEMALVEEKPRSASARASQDTALLCLNHTEFKELLDKKPQLAIKMTSVISARLRVFMDGEQPEKPLSKTGTNTKVFISYSRRDKDFVLKLNDAVDKYGIDTWVDWENIPLTADWWNEIRLGIENADAFAFIISPDSLTSEVCGREVQTAVDNHKRLIPILHRDPQKGNPMHEKISSHNWIYMRDDAELAANVPQMLEVINTDLDFVKAHTRLLERALGWEREKKNASFVLQGDELLNAERWLESAGSKQPAATSLHIEFIQASRRAANQRQRTLLTASLVGLGIAVVLAIISFFSFLQAREAQAQAVVSRDNALAAEAYANQQASLAATAQSEAEVSRDDALVAKATALAAESFAQEQAQVALTEQAKAEAAQAEAEAQKVIAEEQANLARAGDLAASGQTLLETNPPLAVLLALESDRLVPNNQNAQDVLSLLPVYFPPLVDTFIDPIQYIAKIAWSPTGHLASVSGSNIIFWNLETHQPEKTLSGHEDDISAMAWSADGRLATGSFDGTVIVWNIQTGEPENTWPQLQPQGISGLSWSPLGRLASSSWDGSIVVEDLSGQPTETKFLQSTSSINAVAWSPFGALASGAEDGTVAIWNIQQETIDVTYHDHKAGVLTVAWSLEGALASGSRDSTVAVRNPSGNLQAILRGHTDYVNVVAWSDDNHLASASWDKTVILWDLEQDTPQRVFRGHDGSVGALDWGPEGQLASGSDFIFIWDTTADYALTTYPGHLDWTHTVLWTPEGQLVSAGGDGQIIFWDEKAQTISDSINSWGLLDVSSNNRLLSGGYLLERNTGQEFFLNGDSLVFSPDGNFAAGKTFGLGNEWGLWALAPLFETGEVVSRTFSVDEEIFIQTIAWSPDGSTIATGQTDGSIVLWDFNATEGSATARVTLPGHEGAVTDLAFDALGRLASAGEDRMIIVWNMDTLEKDKILPGISENPVTMISWSPNGDLASISGGDQRIVIWDVETEKTKAILGAPYRGPVTSVAWSPDGTQLAFGGNSYNIYVYNTLYVQTPCTWLTRNMTYAEWSTYLPGVLYQPTCAELPVGTAYLDEAVQVLINGDITTAVERFEMAEAQGMVIDMWTWNSLCWYGALYNQAEITSFACDRAVELDPQNGDLRDSRGISRALLGDFEGAIEDFEAFVAYAQELDYPEEIVVLREQWLDALRQGINPFDEATLATLRGE